MKNTIPTNTAFGALTIIGAFITLAGLTSETANAQAFNKSQGQLEERIDMNRIRLEERQVRAEHAIPPQVLRAAKGIVILNKVKAGFIVAAEVGNGIAMVKNAHGQWSAPAFITTGKGSWGFQIGANNSVTFLLLMNDESLNLLRGGNGASVGMNLEAVAGPLGAGGDIETLTLKKPVLVYSSSAGAFAGISLQAGAIAEAANKNRNFYGVTMGQILFGGTTKATTNGNALIRTLEKYSVTPSY